MSDLVARLREYEKSGAMPRTMKEAADRIEQLEREVSRLRQELGQPLQAERERDACHEELRRIDVALGTSDGHSAVDHIKALVADLAAALALLKEARGYVVDDHGWDYENGGWLADRIDALLERK